MAIAGDEAVRQTLRRQRKELKMRDEVAQQLKARESELEQVKAKIDELDAMAKTRVEQWNETRRGLALNYVRLEGAIMALKVALGTVEEQPIQDAQRLAAEVPQ
jgi:hypothetical protein